MRESTKCTNKNKVKKCRFASVQFACTLLESKKKFYLYISTKKVDFKKKSTFLMSNFSFYSLLPFTTKNNPNTIKKDFYIGL